MDMETWRKVVDYDNLHKFALQPGEMTISDSSPNPPWLISTLYNHSFRADVETLRPCVGVRPSFFWSMVKPRAIPWYCEMLDMSVEDSHVDYLSWIKRLNFTVIISWNIQPKIRTNQTTRKGWTKGVYLFLQPFPPQCQVSQVSNLIKMTSTGQRQRPLLKSGLQKSWMSCPILTQSEKNITWKKNGWTAAEDDAKSWFKVYSSMVLISYLWEVDFCGLSFLWGGFISYRQSAMNLYRTSHGLA